MPANRVDKSGFRAAFSREVVEKFSSNTGIEQIHKAHPEQTAGDLAYAAAMDLLDGSGVEKDEIGLLLFVTQSPDYRRPATSCVLHGRLGLSMDCAAMDINLGCSGFVYGMQVMASMMSASSSKFGLLLLGETASKLTNPQDRTVAMMYGDAGAAILFGRSEEEEIKVHLYTDGSRYRSIIMPAGGFRDMYPERCSFVCADGIERTLYDIYMDGMSVFSFSISDVPKAIEAFLERTRTDVDDYDLFLFHQANRFIIKQLARKLKIPEEKIPVSLDRFGNTGGVSIPLTACDSLHGSGRRRIHVLACGFGIGLSWGVASFALDAANIGPIAYTDDFYAEGKLEPGSY